MSRGELIGLIVGLAVASLAMIHAMIKWTGYLFAPSSDPAVGGRRRRWGIVYGALWLVIIALFLRLLQRDGRLRWGDVGMLALVAGSFWAVQGLIVWLGRVIERANARAAAAAQRDDGPEAEGEEPEETGQPGETAAAAAAPPRPWRDRLQSGLTLLIVLGVIALGELSPLMRALDDAVAQHEAAWLAGTIGLAVTGFVFLMGGAIDMVVSRGTPMSRTEIEAMAQIHREVAMRGGRWSKTVYRTRGTAMGAQAEGQASFAEIKAAWRTGAWRQSRRFRRIFAMAIGALGLLLGGFGIPFVLGTAGIKLLVLAAWGFVLFQLVRGFRRA
jgi:hypothetical protein